MGIPLSITAPMTRSSNGFRVSTGLSTNKADTPRHPQLGRIRLHFLMLNRFFDDKEPGYRDIDGRVVNLRGTPFRFTDDAHRADRETWVASTCAGSRTAPIRAASVCLLSTDMNPIGRRLAVESRNGRAMLLTLPPAGLVILM